MSFATLLAAQEPDENRQRMSNLMKRLVKEKPPLSRAFLVQPPTLWARERPQTICSIPLTVIKPPAEGNITVIQPLSLEGPHAAGADAGASRESPARP